VSDKRLDAPAPSGDWISLRPEFCAYSQSHFFSSAVQLVTTVIIGGVDCVVSSARKC
jgi:hypothetical protein